MTAVHGNKVFPGWVMALCKSVLYDVWKCREILPEEYFAYALCSKAATGCAEMLADFRYAK